MTNNTFAAWASCADERRLTGGAKNAELMPATGSSLAKIIFSQREEGTESAFPGERQQFFLTN